MEPQRHRRPLRPGTATATAAATAAPVTGTISVYSALNESTNNEFFGAFRKAYPGVTVNVLPLAAAGELQTRIRTEKASPKADIFIGGSSEFHDPLGKEGLLEAYVAPNAKDIAAQFKEASGLWTGWYTGIFGFISNTDRLTKEVGGKKPATWDDLLDPAWKGKLALPTRSRPAAATSSSQRRSSASTGRGKGDGFHEEPPRQHRGQLHRHIALAISNVSRVFKSAAPELEHDILTEKGKNPVSSSRVPADTASKSVP